MADEPTNVSITLRDVYDELRKLHDQVASMTPQGKTISDHESRLRSLERWKYALPGSLLLAIASICIAILEVHH